MQKTGQFQFRVAVAATTTIAVFALGCNRNPTGPDPESNPVPATLRVQSTLPQGAEQLLGVSNARVRLVRQPTGELLDTAVAVQFNGTSATYTARALVPSGGVRATIFVVLLNGAGAAVFEADPVNAAINPGANELKIDRVNYVGVGSDAAAIDIAGLAGPYFYGDTVKATGIVSNNAGGALTGVPILWKTTTPTRVSVPDFATGTAVASTTRGAATLIATLFTGHADTANFEVQPRPSQLVAMGGTARSGIVGETISQPLSVRVVAPDGLPVASIPVSFIAAAGSLSTDTARSDQSGDVTVDWTLGTLAGVQTVTASAGGVPSATTFAADASAGAAAAVTRNSGDGQTAIVATAVADPPSVTLLDGYGNPVAGIQVLFNVTGGGGSIADTTPTTDSLGMATLGQWVLGLRAGSNTVVASAPGDPALAPLAFSAEGLPALASAINAKGATGKSGLPGAQLAEDLIVVVTDSLGNAVPNTAVNWTIVSGTGSIRDDTSATDSIGTSTNAYTTGTTAGSATVVASIASVASVRFDITIIPGPPGSLRFLSQPTDISAGEPLNVRVGVYDSYGNLATANSPTAISLLLVAGSGLRGPATVATISGVSVFDSTTVAQVGTQALIASSPGLQSDTSTQFAVSAALATRLSFVTQPGDATAGAPLSPGLSVSVLDGLGNTVASDSISVTVSLLGASLLSGTTTAITAAGTARFADLSVPGAGNGFRVLAVATGLEPDTSAAFSITAGAPSQVAFTVQPSNASAGEVVTPAIAGQIRDASGNRIAGDTATITLSLITTGGVSTSFGGTASVQAVDGDVSFANLSIAPAATYQLVLTGTGLVSDTSVAFDIAPGAGSVIQFDVQPQTTPRTAVMKDGVVVSLRDSLGNLVTTDSNGAVVLSIVQGTGTAAATLSQDSAGFISGLATFNALTIDSAGSGYRIQATSLDLATISDSFDILADTASALAFVNQPASVAAGDSLPTITVAALTSGGIVDPSYTGVITLLLLNNPNGDSLVGNLSGAAVNGVASFPGLYLSSSSSGYRLMATSGSLALDSSSFFDIAPATATAIWTGTGAVSWTSPESWGGGTPPGPSDTVWISGRPDAQPTLDADVVLAGLTLAAGAKLNTGGFLLTLTGDLQAGNTIEGTGSVRMTGTAATLSGTVNNLVVAGQISLAGDATSTGNLDIEAEASLKLAGYTLDVQGDLTVTTGEPGSGLVLNQTSDALFVAGAARFTGTQSGTSTTAGNFLAGTMSFRGAFLQETNLVNMRSFAVTGSDVSFDGPVRQIVTMQSAAAGNSAIRNLNIANPGGVEFQSDLYVAGTLTVESGSELLQAAPYAVYLTSSIPVTAGTYAVSNTHLVGNFTLTTPVEMKLAGTNLFVDDGSILRLAGRSLELGGNLDVAVDATGAGLVMTNPADFLQVDGDVLFSPTNGQANSTGSLTEGVIRVGGDFTQSGIGPGDRAFVSTGTRVVLDGSGAQTVSFESPGASQSRFAALEIANTGGGVLLGSDVTATDRLVSLLGVTPTVFGGGFNLAVAGFDIDGLVLDNTTLVSDSGSIRRFDFVTFQNYSPSATQLTVRHPGAAVPVFRSTRFLTTPTTGFYIRAEDTVMDGDTLTINFSESIPDDGTNRTVTAGGAIVNWGIIPWSLVGSGGAFACGVKLGGMAFCWGNNVSGERGDGTFSTVNTPTAVVGALNIQRYSIGADHSCAITAGLVSYCWGNNGWGRLGNGTTSRSNVPVPVSGGFNFQAISAGFFSNCAVTTTGLAYCWGRNDHGQLGDGTTAYDSLPSAVSGGIRFQVIATGGLHACGISFSGAAFCWGQNTAGQLGDGTTVQSDVPVAVAGGLRFRFITAGDTHTCAIATDGTSYCWGTNWDGRLGDGGNTNRSIPTPVSGGLSFEELSAGGSHTCGVTASAVAYCWGSNGNGQIGDGSTVLRNLPTRVLTSTRFQDIAAGKTPQTCGAAIDGSAHCWGWNFFGQLGNGTNTDSRTPVVVSEP